MVVVIAATTLAHSYAPSICASFGCDASGMSAVRVLALVGMAVAGSVLLFRAFKYRSIDYSIIRIKVTFMVVFVACAHTIIHNLCHAFFGGACGPASSGFTLVFLILVSGVLGVNPRALWTVGVNYTVEGPKTADREYFITMIGDRVFILQYWAFTALIMWVVWVLGIAEWFFEPGILATLLAGLFGPFIALWFANNERNKRIIENHVYKMQILGHVSAILRVATLLFQQLQSAGLNEGGDGLGRAKDDWAATRGALVSEYQYNKGHVEMLNTNTYVPADIRRAILSLMQVIDSILQYGPMRKFDDMDIRHLLEMLDLLSRNEYFTMDRDPYVRKMWMHTKQNIRNAKEEVAKLT